jgi:diguanylate cyclase (GGDEF)-like protein
MRDILELCARMDELAESTYRSMSRTCDDATVAAVMERMGAEEAVHVGWWRELMGAWDTGLLPDIYADTGDIRGQMTEILASLEAAVPEAGLALTAEQCLSAAVSIEFFMLDPMFGEMLDLAEPARARKRHDAYSRHIERLIAAVEEHFRGETLAGFLARVLRRSLRENRRLASYAMRDALTGIANRRAFTAHLRQWSAWSARYGRPLAVILLDIDEFKRVNDSFGHAAGDETLVQVAAAVGTATRASDLVARYGGDEFAVMAPETDPEDARRLADRILAAVRMVGLPVADGVVRPTVSIGASVMLDPPDSDPRSVDELLASADQALYAAKQSGRNRAADPVLLSRELV